MKKLITLIMLMSFVTVQANAVSGNGLELAFKEFSFTLATIDVENNKTQYIEATKKMNEAVSNAQKSGMTNEQLIQFAADKIVDPNAKASFELVLTKIKLQNISSKESRKLVIEALQQAYPQGAQWSPEATYVVLGVVLVAAIVVAAATGSISTTTRGSGNCYEDWYCDTYWDSYWGGYVEDCYTDYVCY